MSIALIAVGGILAYLFGSIPTAVWLGKGKYGMDIREHGSGNAGATNTFRVLGKKAGSVVMAIDVFKGFLATFLPILFTKMNWASLQGEELALYQIAFGILAVTGHILPIFAGFKGGKGVATLLGMILAIHSLAAGTCILVFLAIFLSTGYVSLGSMLAGLTFPILMFFPFYQENEQFNKVLFIFGAIVSMLLIFTHRKNIQRLLKGEENSFKKKKIKQNEDKN